MDVYVENNAGMAFDGWCAAWVYDLDLWGTCGQGPDEAAALSDVRKRITGKVDLNVVERTACQQTGDERAFERDHRPCTDDERRTTLAILDYVRPQTLALVRALPDEVLDWEDPERTLPSYARWRTIRQLAWHVADTESRYYLPVAGLDSKDRADDLLTELDESAAHVRKTVEAMPAGIERRSDDGEWTSVKVLRRLAWHERGEVAVMHKLATAARLALKS
ncbi:DinB family protein [Flindersiella endophytica]